MRVAVVGAGVSGLVAAYLLAGEHDVTLFEADDRLGGHTNTVRVDTAHETHWIDTGFIVLNDRTYPNFTKLLARLGVATQPTHMGFSVKGEDEDFEYAGTPRGVLCQPSNGLRPSFWRMLADLVRFNRELAALLRTEREDPPVGEILARGRYSQVFTDRLLIPQLSAVWSGDPAAMWQFPARFLAEFFANHGMLGFRDRPRWSTVAGGSVRYVEAIARALPGRIRLSTPVRAITREESGVQLQLRGGERARFDQVVIATHSDQALAMLRDPDEQERAVLGAIAYQPNEAVLHTDAGVLPRRHAARQAWNYHLLREPSGVSTVTYYMNHLQRLRSQTTSVSRSTVRRRSTPLR